MKTRTATAGTALRAGLTAVGFAGLTIVGCRVRRGLQHIAAQGDVAEAVAGTDRLDIRTDLAESYGRGQDAKPVGGVGRQLVASREREPESAGDADRE